MLRTDSGDHKVQKARIRAEHPAVEKQLTLNLDQADAGVKMERI